MPPVQYIVFGHGIDVISAGISSRSVSKASRPAIFRVNDQYLPFGVSATVNALVRAGGTPQGQSGVVHGVLGTLAVIVVVAVFNAYKIEGQEQGQGLPLPLVSYGGSSMVASVVTVAVILGLSRDAR